MVLCFRSFCVWVPMLLTTDQRGGGGGGKFRSGLDKEMMKIVGIRHHFTTAYYP